MENTKSAQSYPIGFNQGLAALRGVAVIMVILYHCWMPGFQGGYLGVDIFFVLSGYLITCTLLKQFNDQASSFFTFYWRRFLRLFPALAIVCLALYLSRWLLADRVQPLKDILAASLYVSNWTRAAQQEVPIYLAHTWSLSIEEQFYLLWPALVLLFLTGLGRSRAPLAALSLAVAVALWRAYNAWAGAFPERLYNSFDLRSDGLLLGCALALYTYRNLAHAQQAAHISKWILLAAGPAFMVVYFRFRFDSRFMFYLGYAISNLATTALVSLLTVPGKGTSKPLPLLAVLIYFGEISYGLYLWHYPISHELMVHYQLSKAVRAVIVCISSFALAALSYHLIEKPVLALRNLSIGATLGRFIFPANACAILAGIWIFWQVGIVNFLHPANSTPHAQETSGATLWAPGADWSAQSGKRSSSEGSVVEMQRSLLIGEGEAPHPIPVTAPAKP
jgi:peptidoglycan/LPS O-acetylase OafA/YrhL